MTASGKHPGRAQVVIGGTASETQVLFFTDAEAREWATTGPPPTTKKTRSAVPPQPAPVQLHKAADGPATAAVDDVPPTLTGGPETVAQPALPASQTAAAGPADTTPSATSPTAPAVVDDDQAVGLREAHEHHLPEITVAALRYARANDRTFPGPVDKRGAELLYRVGDLKRWARNRPRAAVGTTDLD
ncbi:hypothetical protein [Streptomyces sp. NBC_01451]|uniref:hypothetical protein n=1 Tax=Streptomyces sp. NBC_01451 TaxID=2903872 RepID=UPI002E33E9BF|nr:hypothetical protein [Streptomyces sp. NBC_01451]